MGIFVWRFVMYTVVQQYSCNYTALEQLLPHCIYCNYEKESVSKSGYFFLDIAMELDYISINEFDKISEEVLDLQVRLTNYINYLRREV